MFLKGCLTKYWWHLQFGIEQSTLEMWWLILRVLELDKKAQLDLFLLAQAGPVGRTYANQILWNLMCQWGLEGSYRDLSNKCSYEVGMARKNFDRPPVGHRDLRWWRWSYLEKPMRRVSAFSPSQRPPERWDVRTGPGGEPLPPPHCWGTPHQ